MMVTIETITKLELQVYDDAVWTRTAVVLTLAEAAVEVDEKLSGRRYSFMTQSVLVPRGARPR